MAETPPDKKKAKQSGDRVKQLTSKRSTPTLVGISSSKQAWSSSRKNINRKKKVERETEPHTDTRHREKMAEAALLRTSGARHAGKGAIPPPHPPPPHCFRPCASASACTRAHIFVFPAWHRYSSSLGSKHVLKPAGMSGARQKSVGKVASPGTGEGGEGRYGRSSSRMAHAFFLSCGYDA